MSARSNSAHLVYGGEPRVDLLPPEIRAQAKQRALRVVLALAVVVSVVVTGGAYALARVQAAAAETRLLAVQDRTASIAAEELTYAEATSAAGLIEATKSTLAVGASTEVMWGEIFDEISANLPDGVVIEAGTLTARAPWEAELAVVGSLSEPRVATFELTLVSASLPDSVAIVDGLSDVTGFADAWPDETALTDGQYKTLITINVGAEALSGRFQTEDAEVTQ